MKPAISVKNLGKQYKLGLVHTDLLSEKLGNGLRAMGSRIRGGNAQSKSKAQQHEKDTFWALKDINFEVQPGEVMGVIGRNGAGKSTLLKILSRITSPTLGEIQLQGRVASLLEVGTGFHPELTGRENIFLNGAILGMKRQEINEKFDEIVVFAEVQKFIDTPVKRYSSGMYVRLAFAVAAHLEPEILIVDEVLAVGDAAFQRKCLDKMNSVAGEGRTVLFVSHNMDAVRRLCSRVIWLDQGKIEKDSTTLSCVASYQQRNLSNDNSPDSTFPFLFTNGIPIKVHSLSIKDMEGNKSDEFDVEQQLQIQIVWENERPIYRPRIGIIIQTLQGAEVLTVLDSENPEAGWVKEGRKKSVCIIPGSLLNEGRYLVELCCDSPKGNDIRRSFSLDSSRQGPLIGFDLLDGGNMPGKYYGEEGFRDAAWPGVLMLPVHWKREEIQ